MPSTILVVEDEEFVRELVSHTLQGAGYSVVAVESGEEALQQALRLPPDLVVLDIRLPGISGWEVCRQLRAGSNVPILMLTALGTEEDVLRGLRTGADDYLTKPCSPAILAARVQALLRRATTQEVPSTLRMRGLTIDLASARVFREGQPIHLTASEFRILATLARNAGQVMSSRELIHIALGYPLNEAEATEIIKVHVRHLRQKIEPDRERPRYVLTVRGLGYMLNRNEVEDAA